MLLSWLEDDITSERTDHSTIADAVAIAACLLAALLVHHHEPEARAGLYVTASMSHALAAHCPAHGRPAEGSYAIPPTAGSTDL